MSTHTWDVLCQNITFYPALWLPSDSSSSIFRWRLTKLTMSSACHLGKMASFTNPVRFPANVFATLAETRRTGTATGTRQETPLYPFGFASTMTNIFLTIVLHRTIVGFLVTLQKEETAGETILPKPWKTLREGRGVSAYLTELDSDYMINSLLS